MATSLIHWNKLPKKPTDADHRSHEKLIKKKYLSVVTVTHVSTVECK